MDVPVDLAGCSLGVTNHDPYNLIPHDDSLLTPLRISLAQILTPRDSRGHRLHRTEPHLVHKTHRQHNLAPNPTHRRLRWPILGLLQTTRQPHTPAQTRLILLLIGIQCLIMLTQLHRQLRLPYPLSMNCWP
jgi:hypothetical protein